MRKAIAIALLLASAAAAQAAVETYKIDPSHSSVGFKIRHFFTPVPGSFTKFSGTVQVDRENLEKSSVEASIETASLTTANDRRDNDLRSANFFDATTHPTATFKSKSWKKTGDDLYDVVGDLTMHGMTHEVTLQVRSLGFGPGAQGRQLSGWEATTRLNRRTWGVNGPSMLDKVISDEVEVSITIEAVLQS